MHARLAGEVERVTSMVEIAGDDMRAILRGLPECDVCDRPAEWLDERTPGPMSCGGHRKVFPGTRWLPVVYQAALRRALDMLGMT